MVASKTDSKLYFYTSQGYSTPYGVLDQTLVGIGTGPGQLRNPTGVCIHKATGTVAVVDTANNGIQLFTIRGEYILQYTTNLQTPSRCMFIGDKLIVDDSGNAKIKTLLLSTSGTYTCT